MNANPQDATPGSADELIAILEQEVGERNENVRTARYGSIALVTGLLALCGYLWFAQRTSPWEFLSNYGAFFLVAMGGVALTARHRSALLRAEHPDPRLAGFLIEALSYRDAAVVQHAERALTQQLCTVSALSPHHAEMLASRLAKSRNLGFVKSALAILKRLGTASCLDWLDDLPKQKPYSLLALDASAEIRLRSARQRIQAEETKLNLNH